MALSKLPLYSLIKNHVWNVGTVQGGPRKVKPTTIFLVTFECVGKIQWFLADVNCIQQEVVRCKFYAHFVIINTWHARWRHIRSIRHWNHWANGGHDPKIHPFHLRHLDHHLTHECLGDSTHHLKRQFDRCTHICTTMQQSHTAWNTIACTPVGQNVTLIEPYMWPPNSPDLNLVNYTFGWSCTSCCMQFTSAKNHWILPMH